MLVCCDNKVINKKEYGIANTYIPRRKKLHLIIPWKWVWGLTIKDVFANDLHGMVGYTNIKRWD